MDKAQVREELRSILRLNKAISVLEAEKKEDERKAKLFKDCGTVYEMHLHSIHKCQEIIDSTIEELHRVVDKYIGAMESCLSLDERTVAILVFFEGKKVWQVAEKMCVSDITIKRILDDIVRKLSIRLTN